MYASTNGGVRKRMHRIRGASVQDSKRVDMHDLRH